MSWPALLVFGVGVVLMFEGAVVAAAPSIYERLAEMMRDVPVEARRLVGLLAVVLGAGLVVAVAG